MRILTLDNECFFLNNLPEEIDEDLRFSVLDNSDPKDPDFFFIPLIFLESFSSPAIVMEIGGKEIMMPIDWHIAIGDGDGGDDLEVLPLTSINDRGFDAFVFNPLSSFKTEFQSIKITNFYNDVKWYFPKTRNGQLITIPLEQGENPECAFFIKEVSRQTEIIDYTQLF